MCDTDPDETADDLPDYDKDKREWDEIGDGCWIKRKMPAQEMICGF